MRIVRSRLPLLTVALAGALALASAGRVAADEVDASGHAPSRADDLFALGKERFARNDYGAACALFAESFQLDPATGSLLALALCHERQGKLASALREYEQVAARARLESRPDREQAARTQIAALRGRVSTLTLRTTESASDLTIRVNEVPVAPDQLGAPIPVDGGFVIVQAEAEGRQPWQQHMTFADGGQAQTLTIPALQAQLASSPPQPHRPLRKAPQADSERRARLGATERAGIALMAAGAVGGGVALAFTVRAVRKDHESDAGCVDDVCSAEGRERRLEARRAGNAATIAVTSAVAVAATGLITYLVGRKRSKETPRRASAKLQPSGWIGAHGAGAALSGSF